MKTGWKTVKLGDIADIYNGNTIPDEEKKRLLSLRNPGLPFIATKDVGFDGLIDYQNGINIPQNEAVDFKVAKANAVLVCAEGGSAGRKIGHIDRDVHFGNKLFALNAKEAINPRYLYHFCLSEDFRKKFKALMAGLIGGVSIAKFKLIQIPLPPLAEQKRIVALLDEAFAGIDEAMAKAEANLTNIKSLFSSHLAAVFSPSAKGWPNAQLEALTVPESPITYGVVKPGEEGEIAFIRGGDLVDGKVRLTQLRTITKAVSDQYARTLLKGGELLICLVGQPGQVAVAPKTLAGANIARQVGLIRLRGSMDPEFVKYFLQSPAGASALGAKESGSVQQVINLGELRQIPVPCPDLANQRAIVSALEMIEHEIHVLSELAESKISALEALKSSMLTIAFAGELAA
jgi:type I restriction enzyme, S subunit